MLTKVLVRLIPILLICMTTTVSAESNGLDDLLRRQAAAWNQDDFGNNRQKSRDA